MVQLWGKRGSTSSRDEFDRLTRPHVDMLYRTAFRMTADPHSAEDLVQETCLRAFRAFDNFKPGTNFKAWIFRILSNLIIDNARRNNKTTYVEWDEQETGDTNALEQMGVGRSPEIHVLYKSFMNDAIKAMDCLTPEIRIVVAMALLEEFTYQEIAESLDCPIGTVRSRLSRGRKRLQKELAEYLPVNNQSPGFTQDSNR